MTNKKQHAGAPIKALLGRKLGMTQVWDADGHLVPLTVVQVGTNVVTQVRTDEVDGYSAIQLGFGEIDSRKVTKPLQGHFEKAGVAPRRHLVEVRTSEHDSYEVGQELDATTFEAGEGVDVSGTTKGKGFAGVMKRHGFAGVSASHGAHRNHRKPGSIGACATPGRIFKGLRMARPHGWQPSYCPEPDDPGRGRREGPAAHQRRHPGSEERRGPGSLLREGCVIMADDRNVDVIDIKGKKAGSVVLPGSIFDVPTNIPLMHQVVVAQLAAARQGTHATKTRGEVAGGGKKPFRQKGTGNARQGSIRAPHFTGGGIVHGPQPRDYDQRTPKKMKQGALRSALSDRARADRIHVVTALFEGDKPSTKAALAALSAIVEDRQALVVLERGNELTALSLRNVPEVHVLWADQLNTYDVLDADDIVFTQAALESFLGTKEETK